MALKPRSGATSKAPMPYVVPTTSEWDGNDGSWSTFRIGVGTPPEDFRVLVSTMGYQTWVPHADGCTKSNDVSNCASLRGSEHFRTASSVGFQSNQSSTWEAMGEQDLNLETRLGYGGQGQYGYDTVYLGASQETDTIRLDRQIVAGLKDKAYFLGVLGLSRTSSKFSGKSVPSIIENLKDENTIPSWSYGYTAGASYQTNKVPGSLILGGYDQARLEPTKFNFTFTSTGDDNDYSKSLSVSVVSIEASNTLSGSSEKLTASSHVSIIDTTVAQLWLPVDICSKFESAFGITYDATTGLYTINETTRTKLKTLNPTITITLADPSGLTNEDGSSTTTSIQLPFGAFDLQASWPYYENPTYYFPIRRAANDSQYTLGRTLLQEAYLIVDAERRNFSLAQAKFPNPLPEPDIVAIHAPLGDDGNPDSAQPTSSPLSKNPAKIGVAVGAAAGVVVILVLLWLWWRRRHRSRRDVTGVRRRVVSEVPSADWDKSYMDVLQRPVESSGNELSELAMTGTTNTGTTTTTGTMVTAAERSQKGGTVPRKASFEEMLPPPVPPPPVPSDQLPIPPPLNASMPPVIQQVPSQQSLSSRTTVRSNDSGVAEVAAGMQQRWQAQHRRRQESQRRRREGTMSTIQARAEESQPPQTPASRSTKSRAASKSREKSKSREQSKSRTQSKSRERTRTDSRSRERPKAQRAPVGAIASDSGPSTREKPVGEDLDPWGRRIGRKAGGREELLYPGRL